MADRADTGAREPRWLRKLKRAAAEDFDTAELSAADCREALAVLVTDSALLQRAQEMRERAERWSSLPGVSSGSAISQISRDVIALLDALEATSATHRHGYTCEQAEREIDAQMTAKLEAQQCLRLICGALDLRLDQLADGWQASLPIIFARIETITDEADRAFRERDAALAAGVGVPPDEDSVAQSAENADVRGLELDCEWLEGEVANLSHALGVADDLLRRLSEWDMLYVSPEGKPITADGPYWQREIAKVRGVLAREARSPNPEPAGVGEARPAEPQHGFSDTTNQASVGAPAEEQPDARADEDWMTLIGEGAKRRDAELAGLREQLDAARQALTQILAVSFIQHAWRIARAALGDVAAAETSVSALDQIAVETRGGGEAS